MPFWQFFREGRDGHALLVQPSRIPRWIWKILFALGAYEFLATRKAKLEGALFCRVQSGKKTVWANFNFLPNKLIFCCEKYSRGETICGNMVLTFADTPHYIWKRSLWYVGIVPKGKDFIPKIWNEFWLNSWSR